MATRYLEKKYQPQEERDLTVTLEYSKGMYCYVVIGPGTKKGVNRVLMMDAKTGQILADKASKDLYRSGVLWKSIDF